MSVGMNLVYGTTGLQSFSHGEQVTLGGLMQTSSAFGRVQDALSYFVSVYDTIAQLAAVIHRLSGLHGPYGRRV